MEGVIDALMKDFYRVKVLRIHVNMPLKPVGECIFHSTLENGLVAQSDMS